MALQQTNKNIVNDAIIKDISDVIHGLSFGTVTITVHNSKIVQVDVSKKSRFEDVWQQYDSGGGI